MKKTIAIYATLLAAGAILLEWLQFRHLARSLESEIYVFFVGLFFACLGGWVVYKLTHQTKNKSDTVNEQAFKTLGITGQERKVLKLLVVGKSNKEIARELGVSPNTIKSQVTSLFRKLEVSGRVEAINLARELKLVQ